ncbi:MAG TPA: hypothetical protein VGP91_13940 [Actinoplanes sp.]|jgi:hypothetical protein|nr:hypothetical protein [Actinoplanes sp.]
MRVEATLGFAAAAAVSNAMVVGATLDQPFNSCRPGTVSGAVAYATYARAADLTGGLRWYPTLAAGAALSTGAAVAGGMLDHPDRWRAVALTAAAVGTVAHMLVTARAAPTMLSRLACLTTTRTGGCGTGAVRPTAERARRLQVAAVAASVWAVVATVGAG